jgi:hypothetical protein
MAGVMRDIRMDRDAGHSGTPHWVLSRPVPPVSGTNVPKCPVLSQMSRESIHRKTALDSALRPKLK